MIPCVNKLTGDRVALLLGQDLALFCRDLSNEFLDAL